MALLILSLITVAENWGGFGEDLIMKINSRMLLLFFLTLFLTFMSFGCSINPFGKGTGRQSLSIQNDMMIHARQVLERYDAKGNSVPQYFEIWATAKQSMCIELDENGKEIMTAIDSKVFMLDYQSLKENYFKDTVLKNQEYVDRECTVHLMENGGSDDWLKLYIDSETSFVLFCDAPLFKLKTADLEVVPFDENIFSEPAG